MGVPYLKSMLFALPAILTAVVLRVAFDCPEWLFFTVIGLLGLVSIPFYFRFVPLTKR